MASRDPRVARRPVAANRSQAESSTQAAQPPPRRHLAVQRAPLVHNNSSIRIRRLPSSRPTDSAASDAGSIGGNSDVSDTAVTGRRRSSSAPQPMTHLTVPGSDLEHHISNEPYHPAMPVIQERTPSDQRPPTVERDFEATAAAPAAASRTQRPRGLTDLHTAGSGMQASLGAANSARANRGLSRMRGNSVRSRPQTATSEDEYDNHVLGLLDLVDPEVQTLGTLTNVQNSLFVPDLGRWVNRRPTYDLTSRPSSLRATSALDPTSRSRAGTLRRRAGTVGSAERPPTIIEPTQDDSLPKLERPPSISSQLTDSHWAVLPHGESLEGWTDEDIIELNDHVRHLLHSRREGFKRSWRGFKKYISKPLGLFVFVYAVLITLFGATWVIFLIGWIYVGERQSYAVNVIDNVLVALFAVVGDGLAPFRAVDTYHMCFIAHFHHLTWRLRKERDMPKLPDHNDLPRRRLSATDVDLEGGKTVDDAIDTADFSVLSPTQQRRLQYHQAKFSKSHTFYRPHETATHHAFPLRLLVAVVVLLDCHSLFQVALGTCTWSIDYHVRPEALTATILSCSITVNILAGVLVSIGDKRTRKKDVLEKMFRQGLTKEAIEKIQRRHDEHDRNNYGELDADEHDRPVNHGKSRSSKDLPRFSLDLHRNQRDNHPRYKDTPQITKDIPRVSRDLPRLSQDLSKVVSTHAEGPSANNTSASTSAKQ